MQWTVPPCPYVGPTIVWLGTGTAFGLLLGVLLALLCLRRRAARDVSSHSTAGSHNGASVGEVPLHAIAAQLPLAVVLYSEDGDITYSNLLAQRLLFRGEATEGYNFLQLLRKAPEAVSKALSEPGDAVFSLNDDGLVESFQLLQRTIVLNQVNHTLLLLNPLTRQIARREVEVLKKVIRVINHELNNSLASLSSFVSTGRFIVGNPKEHHRLARVFDGMAERTKHLQTFLNDYARLSRLPKPRVRSSSWAPVLAQLRHAFPLATIDDPPDAESYFDATQVEQALINLLKNATEAGADHSAVRVVFRKTEGSLEIGVLDRGAGFAAEALSQGLLPFYTTKEGGTGVGLALCREIADGHGGSLRIKQREGGGAAVYLVLPVENPRPFGQVSTTLTLTQT